MSTRFSRESVGSRPGLSFLRAAACKTCRISPGARGLSARRVKRSVFPGPPRYPISSSGCLLIGTNLVGPYKLRLSPQSVNTQYASHDRGFDGHKKVKGCKRHGVVDILGNLLTSVVHSAKQSDTIESCHVLAKASQKHKTIKAFSGDQGYQGSAVEFVKNELGLSLTILVKRKAGFSVLSKRWLVERTFAWLGHFRRLAKDFEILTSTAENVIRLAMLKITIAK